jgi:hypothetical protein
VKKIEEHSGERASLCQFQIDNMVCLNRLKKYGGGERVPFCRGELIK